MGLVSRIQVSWTPCPRAPSQTRSSHIVMHKRDGGHYASEQRGITAAMHTVFADFPHASLLAHSVSSPVAPLSTGGDYHQRIEAHYKATGSDMSNSGYKSKQRRPAAVDPPRNNVKDTGPDYVRHVEDHFARTGEDVSNSGRGHRHQRADRDSDGNLVHPGGRPAGNTCGMVGGRYAGQRVVAPAAGAADDTAAKSSSSVEEIQTVKFQGIPLEVPVRSTVKDLKKEILRHMQDTKAHKRCIPIEYQRVEVNGKELRDDSATLLDMWAGGHLPSNLETCTLTMGPRRGMYNPPLDGGPQGAAGLDWSVRNSSPALRTFGETRQAMPARQVRQAIQAGPPKPVIQGAPPALIQAALPRGVIEGARPAIQPPPPRARGPVIQGRPPAHLLAEPQKLSEEEAQLLEQRREATERAERASEVAKLAKAASFPSVLSAVVNKVADKSRMMKGGEASTHFNLDGYTLRNNIIVRRQRRVHSVWSTSDNTEERVILPEDQDALVDALANNGHCLSSVGGGKDENAEAGDRPRRRMMMMPGAEELSLFDVETPDATWKFRSSRQPRGPRAPVRFRPDNDDDDDDKFKDIAAVNQDGHSFMEEIATLLAAAFNAAPEKEG